MKIPRPSLKDQGTQIFLGVLLLAYSGGLLVWVVSGREYVGMVVSLIIGIVIGALLPITVQQFRPVEKPQVRELRSEAEDLEAVPVAAQGSVPRLETATQHSYTVPYPDLYTPTITVNESCEHEYSQPENVRY